MISGAYSIFDLWKLDGENAACEVSKSVGVELIEFSAKMHFLAFDFSFENVDVGFDHTDVVDAIDSILSFLRVDESNSVGSCYNAGAVGVEG